jgi:hypothetical protein
MVSNNTTSNVNLKNCLKAFYNNADGAAAYIVVVVVWYFVGVAMLLLWQIKRKQNFSEPRTKLLLQSMESHIRTKQLLGDMKFPILTKQYLPLLGSLFKRGITKSSNAKMGLANLCEWFE